MGPTLRCIGGKGLGAGATAVETDGLLLEGNHRLIGRDMTELDRITAIYRKDLDKSTLCIRSVPSNNDTSFEGQEEFVHAGRSCCNTARDRLGRNLISIEIVLATPPSPLIGLAHVVVYSTHHFSCHSFLVRLALHFRIRGLIIRNSPRPLSMLLFGSEQSLPGTTIDCIFPLPTEGTHGVFLF